MSCGLHIHALSWSPEQRRRHEEAHLLRDITLDAARGEFVGLIGPNGSGKTSLLRCAFRFSKPLAGSVALDQNDVWGAAPRWAAQRIAVLLQELPDDFGLTVEQIARMGRTPHKHLLDGDTAEDAAIVAAALRDVDMWHARERAFATLSGGEKQRTLLARALAQQPSVLMLDEPTNHLDLRHQIDLLTLVKRQKLTTLATIHDLNLAAAFCDRLYVIASGAIVAHGTPEQVLSAAMLRDVFEVEAIVDRHPVSSRPRITLIHPI
ncbi:ABC transporter ATP-binding protein [Paraburkholderia xenovorans]|uniref:ABC transporter ATP-binding protein n=1 Tax=Paraburkholderia xenovorans TaxID=36873 RepID=UPI0038BD5982